MSGDSELKPKFKYVDFDLPFILFVKDSLDDLELRKWAEAYTSGERPLPHSPYAPAESKPGNLIIGGGFPVYLPPDELSEFYTVATPHISVGVRTLRRVNPHASTVLMGEVPGDRTGKSSFSSVRVMIAMQDIDPRHHKNTPLFCDLAVVAINHFISHYRVIADRPYVGSVTMPMIHSFTVTTQFEDGSRTTQQYGASSGPLRGMGGAIPDDQDQELREAVASPRPPDLAKTLDANIRDYLSLQNWRLAIIESAVAFEAWLSSFLRLKFDANGLSPEEIDQKFLTARGLPRSITSIAKNLVNEAINFDFASSTEYAAWEVDVRDIRNDVVHGKRFDISKHEAERAYSSMKSAISVIEQNSC